MARQATDLANGLAKAASGDDHAKLDPTKSAIFKVAYDNFNKLEEELKNANTLQDEFVNNYSQNLEVKTKDLVEIIIPAMIEVFNGSFKPDSLSTWLTILL